MIDLNPERALIAAVLKATARAVKDLPVVPDDLAEPRYATVWELALRLARQGADPDPVNVLAEARRSGVVVTAEQIHAMTVVLSNLLTADVSPTQLDWYARAVLDEAVRRHAQQAVEAVAATADKSIGAVVETLERELDAVRQLARRRHEAAQRPARLVVAS